MTILDVGCGNNPIGDMNVDLFISKTPHIMQKERQRVIHGMNFVQANVENLPFEDNSYDIVHASHLLEHAENPLQALRECYRVCRVKTVIKIPDASHEWEFENPYHLYSWNRHTIKQLMERVFPKVFVYQSNSDYYLPIPKTTPREFIRWIIRRIQPHEITTIGLKQV